MNREARQFLAHSQKIYGEVYLDQLADHKQNDRRNHTDAPLARSSGIPTKMNAIPR